MKFSELGLSPKVQAAIEAAGYTEPTPIQAQAIPFALAGRDVLGIAQTGTGKTASFVLPMLTKLETGRARARMPRSLILCPTRELAAQVAENFERYGVNHKLTVALLIGGVSFDEQNRKLDRGADVLIATPGRMLDHVGRGKLLLTGVEILVIDEADRMLDMGFIPDIERICSLLPTRRQTLFFSATMPTEIKRLVDRFLQSPERVEVAPQATTAATITQRFKYVAWDPKEKREALRKWIGEEEVKNAIIFCNRKTDVDILYKSMTRHGFNVGCLHGDMDQHKRTATLDAFRAGTIMFLAASDVAARGLDIPEVSHVFNFDVPVHAEDYVHRIGRTGRAGRKGFSATLVTSDDMRILKEIEGIVKVPLEWVDGPPPEDAGEGSGRRGRPKRGIVRRAATPVARSGEAKPERAVNGRPGGARSGRGRTDGRPGARAAAQTENGPAALHDAEAGLPSHDGAGAGKDAAAAALAVGSRQDASSQPPMLSRRDAGDGQSDQPHDASFDSGAEPASGPAASSRPPAARRRRGGGGDRQRSDRSASERSASERSGTERVRPESGSADRPEGDRPRAGRQSPGSQSPGSQSPGRAETARGDVNRPRADRESSSRNSPDRSARRPERTPERAPDRNPEPVRAGTVQTRPVRRPDADDGPSVRGLGDHVPDFMRRPVKQRPEG